MQSLLERDNRIYICTSSQFFNAFLLYIVKQLRISREARGDAAREVNNVADAARKVNSLAAVGKGPNGIYFKSLLITKKNEDSRQ